MSAPAKLLHFLNRPHCFLAADENPGYFIKIIYIEINNLIF